MDDSENPYAAPRTRSERNANRVPSLALHYPSISFWMTFFLWFNVAAIACCGLLLLLELLFSGPDSEDFTLFLVAFIYLGGPWMIVGWPLASFAPLIYFTTLDRGTPRALPKAIIAFLMLAAWLGLLLLFLLA